AVVDGRASGAGGAAGRPGEGAESQRAGDGGPSVGAHVDPPLRGGGGWPAGVVIGRCGDRAGIAGGEASAATRRSQWFLGRRIGTPGSPDGDGRASGCAVASDRSESVVATSVARPAR